MKKIFKRTLSAVLTAVILLTAIPFAGLQLKASAGTFVERNSSPGKTGWYSGYNHPNCVTYAQCRASEIVGYSFPKNSGDGGSGFWSYYKSGGIVIGGGIGAAIPIAVYSKKQRKQDEQRL